MKLSEKSGRVRVRGKKRVIEGNCRGSENG